MWLFHTKSWEYSVIHVIIEKDFSNISDWLHHSDSHRVWFIACNKKAYLVKYLGRFWQNLEAIHIERNLNKVKQSTKVYLSLVFTGVRSVVWWLWRISWWVCSAMWWLRSDWKKSMSGSSWSSVPSKFIMAARFLRGWLFGARSTVASDELMSTAGLGVWELGDRTWDKLWTLGVKVICLGFPRAKAWQTSLHTWSSKNCSIPFEELLPSAQRLKIFIQLIDSI